MMSVSAERNVSVSRKECQCQQKGMMLVSAETNDHNSLECQDLNYLCFFFFFWGGGGHYAEKILLTKK